MTKFITLLFCVIIFSASAQKQMRPVEELVTDYNQGWAIVQKWIDSATNTIEVLTVDSTKAKQALYQTQVTTHAPMGAVIYFTGGIMIDNGWIRILGSGHKKINRSLPEWNKGKSFKDYDEVSSFLLIADDVVGGFFAINNGRFGKEDIGKVYYLSPDRLVWEPLDLSYSEFLLFCFSGDLVKFYGDMRWPGWQKQVIKMSGDKVYNFNPPLWSKEGKNINKNKRKAVPVEEQYWLNVEARKALKLEE